MLKAWISRAARRRGATSLSHAAGITTIAVLALVGAGVVSLVQATARFDAIAHGAVKPSLTERVTRESIASLVRADDAPDGLRTASGRGRRLDSLRGHLASLAREIRRAERAAVSAASASAHRYRNIGVGALAAALGVLLLFGALMFRTLLWPLRRLRGSAERIGNGDVSATLDGPVSAELRELAEAMEAAADRDRRLSGELEQARLEILDRLARATEHRDDDTYEHTERVGALAARLGQSLGLDPAQVRLLRLAAPLHDVGKIGVSDSILLKPGRLSPAETEQMRRHTTIGAQMLADSNSPVLRMAEEIARSHHERWDGHGYPHGVREDEIPLPARIVAVADVYDALTHDRPYKSAWSVERATAELARNAGTQFDPRVVDALLALGHSTLRDAVRRPVAPAPLHDPAGGDAQHPPPYAAQERAASAYIWARAA